VKGEGAVITLAGGGQPKSMVDRGGGGAKEEVYNKKLEQQTIKVKIRRGVAGKSRKKKKRFP